MSLRINDRMTQFFGGRPCLNETPAWQGFAGLDSADGTLQRQSSTGGLSIGRLWQFA